jgi:hypothetical protein
MHKHLIKLGTKHGAGFVKEMNSSSKMWKGHYKKKFKI